VNKENFIKSLDAMFSHYRENLNARPGNYWDHYSKLIYKQTKLAGDILEPTCFSASGFNGALCNGFSADINKISNFESLFERLINILQTVMVKVAYDKSIFDPIFKRLFRHKSSRHYKDMSSLIYIDLIHWGYEFYRDQIEHYDITSPDLYGVDCVDIGHRKLSIRTLEDFGFFLAIKKSILSPTRTILEIGSGIGELARIFLTTKTCEKYILIDIPPALAYAQRLLSDTFGDDKISFWSKERETIDLSDNNICYFLTPDQVDQAPSFDLGINKASFGEMTPDIVQGYIQVLKKKEFNEFISMNQRIKKSNNCETIGEKQYIEYFSPDYECIRKAYYNARKPFRELAEDKSGVQGYQWLHFHKAEQKAH
jgi:putative sugar O-methyltransferase